MLYQKPEQAPLQVGECIKRIKAKSDWHLFGVIKQITWDKWQGVWRIRVLWDSDNCHTDLLARHVVKI